MTCLLLQHHVQPRQAADVQPAAQWHGTSLHILRAPRSCLAQIPNQASFCLQISVPGRLRVFRKFQISIIIQKLFLCVHYYFISLVILQTKQILERHVIRAGRAYTVSDLKLLANETHPFVLPTSRDPLRLRVKESDKSKLLAVHLHYYLFSFIMLRF